MTKTDPKQAEVEKQAFAEFFEAMTPRVRSDPATGNLGVLRAIIEGRWSRNVVMLFPVAGDVNPHVLFSVLAQIRKQPQIGFEFQADTVIQHARNLLVQRFLKSEAEWSWWHDADMVCPFGDPGFFKERLGIKASEELRKNGSQMAVHRLMSHGKTIVGGTYKQRKRGGSYLGITDALASELELSGPKNQIVDVPFVGTGCALIHRKVYTDIMEKFPERGPKNPNEPYNFFFHDNGQMGEDIAFCALAKQAGHPSFLDTGLFCAHVGSYAFYPGE